MLLARPSPAAYPGFYASSEVILELLPDGTVRVAGRRSSVIAINAPHNATRHIRRTAVKQYVDLLALWEAIHGKAF